MLNTVLYLHGSTWQFAKISPPGFPPPHHTNTPNEAFHGHQQAPSPNKSPSRCGIAGRRRRDGGAGGNEGRRRSAHARRVHGCDAGVPPPPGTRGRAPVCGAVTPLPFPSRQHLECLRTSTVEGNASLQTSEVSLTEIIPRVWSTTSPRTCRKHPPRARPLTTGDRPMAVTHCDRMIAVCPAIRLNVPPTLLSTTHSVSWPRLLDAYAEMRRECAERPAAYAPYKLALWAVKRLTPSMPVRDPNGMPFHSPRPKYCGKVPIGFRLTRLGHQSTFNRDFKDPLRHRCP